VIRLGGDAIVNPLSGERITILAEAEAEAEASVLAWELELAPGGRVPSSHAHPVQEERFTVLEGQMRFRVGRRRVLAQPGDTVLVPPGTAHRFANPGQVPARVSVRTSPALGMRELLETAAAMAREQHAAGRRSPRLCCRGRRGWPPGPVPRWPAGSATPPGTSGCACGDDAR
jgi:mannose-6-phosphate isomerase-like protein (cupin superfamily)